MAGKGVMEFAGPSYHLADIKAACQAAINCYPQKLEGNNWMMKGSPGEVAAISMPGPIRGSFVSATGRWVVASGNEFYEMLVDNDLVVTSTLRGSLATSTGFVGMDDNKTQIAVVDGANLYIFNLLTDVFTLVVSPGWRGSDDVKELDGYFVFVDPGSDQFYISAIDDGTNIDALDFSSADSSPDDIITHRVSHRQLLLFGKGNSTEIWINSGNPAFPFVRYQSYTIDVGCVGKRAAINAADTVFWIGKTERGTGIVYMLVGNQPQRVSTLAVEEKLLSSTDLSQASMWTYQTEGHEFVGINAPGLDTTWVYDAALQQWHERAEWDDGLLPLRSRLVTSFGTQQFAGDDYGKIVRLDDTVNNLSGRTLKRRRTWPHYIQPSMEPVCYYGLELACTTGRGNGKINLQISNDGGTTYGPSLERGLGVTGQWMQRIRWLALGASVNRVFSVWMTDDYPFNIHGAAVQT